MVAAIQQQAPGSAVCLLVFDVTAVERSQFIAEHPDPRVTPYEHLPVVLDQVQRLAKCLEHAVEAMPCPARH